MSNMRSTSKSRLLITVAALSGLMGTSAYAQIDPNDEIIVTARKKAESLQEVPLSVSAFSEAVLEDANIFDVMELSDFTPGFQQQQAFGRDGDRPIIRGTSNILISEGKVGIFVDGVPFIGDSSSLDFSSLRNIEVIRGPQSAVYGRGTLSGAINYVNRDISEEFGGRVSATVAEHGQYELYGSVEGEIADGLRGSVAGKYYKFGGDYTNALTGENLNEQESISLNTALEYDFSENLSVGVRYIYSEDDDGHYAISLQDSSENNCYAGGSRGYFCGTVQAPDTYNIGTPDILNPGLQRESHRVIANVDYSFDSGYDLSGLFGFTDIDERSGADQAFNGSAPLFIGSAFVCNNFIPDCVYGASAFVDSAGASRQAFSGELRLSSPQESDFRWQVGGFIFDNETKGTDYALAQTEFGYDAIGGVSSTRNYAAFGGVEYDFSDVLTAGVEMRFASDKISTAPGASYVLGDYFSNAADPTRIIAGSGSDRSETFESFLPRFTLDYKLNDDTLVYAVASKGNAPGGFNDLDAPSTSYDEEILWNYEAGFKTQINNLRLNMTGYYIDYSNQVLTSTYTSGPGSSTPGAVNSFSDNVGDTAIWGLELDTQIDLTDNFSLIATYGWTDAEFKNGLNADQAFLLGGAGCSGVDYANNDVTLPVGTVIGDGTALSAATACATFADLSGNKAPLVSPHQLTLSADYRADLGMNDMEWFARADYLYRSSFFAQVHNLAESGDSNKVNLNLGVENDTFRIQLWAKNVFNDDTVQGMLRYVDFAAPTLNGERQRAFAITPSSRRQFGVTASANF
ncbi:MAG: TonB-dependent receptor [Alphaproteobacteria bacterium]